MRLSHGDVPGAGGSSETAESFEAVEVLDPGRVAGVDVPVQDADVDVTASDGEFTAVVDEPDGSIAEITYEADPVLLAAVDQARAALAEIAPADSIGEVVGHAVEGEHVLSLFFASRLPGYPDWHWTATLARVGDADEPTVLEVEMLPGESSVLSPAWVPWADRMTADAIIDDSESEFDDDDVEEDDETDGGDAGLDDDDSSDDDGDDDDDLDDEDSDDEDDDLDEDDVAVLALRRDRDGIDIDTIAEAGDVQSDAVAEAVAAAYAEPAVDSDAGADPAIAAGVDPDAGSAFDATDDFTDAGDIEGQPGDAEPGDRRY